MTDDFATRLRTLLAENPRICGFGCNLREFDRETRTYVPKKRDGWRGVEDVEISDSQVERFRKMCAFIEANLVYNHPRARKLIGSYGFKHVLERNAWTEDDNRYVSNGEGIVALMMCGFKPRWDIDSTSPNCIFSVNITKYLRLVKNAERPNYPKKAEEQRA